MTDPSHAGSLLTVDLSAIVANWRLIAQGVAPAKVAAVVKADAYGLGAAQVAPALAAAGCETFIVATLDEGIALRQVLPAPVILVLNGPLPGTEGEFVAHSLVPVLNSLSQITGWATSTKAGSGAPAAALHIDTGMNRLGFDEAELDRLAARPEVLAWVRPILTLSHLACADSRDHPMNAEQRARFVHLAGRLPAMPLSLAASGGCFLGRTYHFDLVRPGAALYGINPTPGRPNPMAQVIRLQGKILQVRDVDSPRTVGYGASYHVAGPSRIATVALGYADGWFRSLGNQGHGVLGGVKVPLVGRVSMDLACFDVGAVPPAVACPGALVDLIGPEQSVDDVAAEAGTIGYEILTALGRRHHRRWITGAGETAA